MLPQTEISLSLPVIEAGGWGSRHAALAAAGCDQALHVHTAPAARLTVCRGALSALGEDMTGRGWPATLLAFLLAHRAGPFTWVLARLTGETPRVETIPGSEHEYRMPAAQAAGLRIRDTAGLWLWERSGLMMLGTTIAAEVRLRVVPARLPGGPGGDAFTRIRKGEPCGQVIPGLARRQRSGVSMWPGDPAVVGAATLTRADGTGFGYASERVTAGLCGRLAGVAWGA